MKDEHLQVDAGPEVPELTRCRGCGWSMHWTGSGTPRCLACRLPTYRRERPATRAWSTWELSLLQRRALSTREIQRRTGRSPLAIQLRRRKLVGPEFTVREWSPEEDAAVLRRDRLDVVLAREIGRTVGAIRTRRVNLAGLTGLGNGRHDPDPCRSP